MSTVSAQSVKYEQEKCILLFLMFVLCKLYLLHVFILYTHLTLFCIFIPLSSIYHQRYYS